jgi:hypothetical protein
VALPDNQIGRLGKNGKNWGQSPIFQNVIAGINEIPSLCSEQVKQSHACVIASEAWQSHVNK